MERLVDFVVLEVVVDAPLLAKYLSLCHGRACGMVKYLSLRHGRAHGMCILYSCQVLLILQQTRVREKR